MRSIWKGSISFGLVNIPVRLYVASRSRELQFKMLHKKDLSEIRYARICKTDGKEVPWEDIVKGYEDEKGNYVVLEEADFERANPKKTKSIEILNFVDEDEIDTIYYETPYYLEPEKGAAKAYSLLREALKKSKKAALGNVVFRNHEHIGIIKPYGDLLVLNQLRYQSEIVDPKDIDIPKRESLPKAELEMALQFINKLTKKFDPDDYADTYTEEIKEIIREKVKGRKVKVKKGETPKSPKIHDIMSLLKESLEQTPRKKAKRRKSA